MPCFDDAILEMKNENDYISKKLDLAILCQAANYWRDRIAPKLILESETSVLNFLQTWAEEVQSMSNIIHCI